VLLNALVLLLGGDYKVVACNGMLEAWENLTIMTMIQFGDTAELNG
jgi:hypothetical protein